MTTKAQNIVLYPHQVNGVKWMTEMEENIITFRTTGGILADEMGLGKTLQMLTLIKNRLVHVRQTLILVPACSTHQWEGEIHNVFRGFKSGDNLPISVLFFRPALRQSGHQIAKSNIVVASFNSFTADFNTRRLLANRQWGRIVVDEAHNFCSMASTRTKALMQLHSKYRWGVTGTPILNSVVDLSVLMSFLRAEPFAEMDCAKCKCSAGREHLVSPECQLCGCSIRQHRCRVTQNWYILHTSGGLNDFENPSVRIPSLILRRDESCLKLPKLDIVTEFITLTSFDREIYDFIINEALNDYVTCDDKRGQRDILIVYLMVLRQALVSPQLLFYDDGYFKQLAKESQKPCTGFCCICLQQLPTEKHVKLMCNHTVHSRCLEKSRICPACLKPIRIRRKLKVSKIENVPIDTECSFIKQRIRDKFGSKISRTYISAKMKFVLDGIQQDIADGHQILVFSQFTRFLHLMLHSLHKLDIESRELTGRVTQEERLQTMSRFRSDPNLKVLLISLKCGGEALNLQSSSRVYIVDPWWNESVELQAIKRSHRIGQKNNVVARKLICNGTIEEKMKDLQIHKRNLCNLFAWGDQTNLETTNLEYIFSFI